MDNNMWRVDSEKQLDFWPDLKLSELSKFLFHERFMPLDPDDAVLNGVRRDMANLDAQIKWIVNGEEVKWP